MAPKLFSKLFKKKRQNKGNIRGIKPAAPGISESKCQVNGDPFDQSKLPLPSPDQRQLELGKRPLSTQEQSLIFRLPLEIRRMIYLELFGGRRVHIDHVFKGPSIFRPYPRGKYRKNHWQWWHAVCQYSNTFTDLCFDHSRFCSDYSQEESSVEGEDWKTGPPPGTKLAGVEWLQCSQMGYEEALPILYGTNVFAVGPALESPFQMSRLLRPDYLSLITSMDIWIGVNATMTPSDFEEGWKKVHPAFFDLFQSTFCNVRQLRLTLHLFPWPDNPDVSNETPERLCDSMDSLAKSREWIRLELSLPDDWYPELKERAEAEGKWTVSTNYWYPFRAHGNCGM